MIGRCMHIICMSLILSVGTLAAQTTLSLTEVKERVKSGMTYIQDDLLVEGTVISIHRCGNLETNINDTYTSATTTADTRTTSSRARTESWDLLCISSILLMRISRDMPRRLSISREPL